MCGRSAYEASGDSKHDTSGNLPVNHRRASLECMYRHQMSKDAAEAPCLGADKWTRMKHLRLPFFSFPPPVDRRHHTSERYSHAADASNDCLRRECTQ